MDPKHLSTMSSEKEQYVISRGRNSPFARFFLSLSHSPHTFATRARVAPTSLEGSRASSLW